MWICCVCQVLGISKERTFYYYYYYYYYYFNVCICILFVALQFTSILSPYLFCASSCYLLVIVMVVITSAGKPRVHTTMGFLCFSADLRGSACTLRALWLVVGSDDVAHINSLMMWHMCSFHPWLQWWQVVLLTCQLKLVICWLEVQLLVTQPLPTCLCIPLLLIHWGSHLGLVYLCMVCLFLPISTTTWC